MRKVLLADLLAITCKVESGNAKINVSMVYLGPVLTVNLVMTLCCFFLMMMLVSYSTWLLLKPMLLIRFFILKADCFKGSSLKTVGLSITDTGMKKGKDGQGILEATLICALSSSWLISLVFISAFSSLERFPSIFMLFSKWNGLSCGNFLTTVQAVPTMAKKADAVIKYRSNRYNRIAFKIEQDDRQSGNQIYSKFSP